MSVDTEPPITVENCLQTLELLLSSDSKLSGMTGEDAQRLVAFSKQDDGARCLLQHGNAL
jgi:hypothetical protein